MSRSRWARLLLAGAIAGTGLMALIVFQTWRGAPGPLPDEAIEELRALYWAQEFEIGREKGRELVADHPGATDVAAWYVLHAVRARAADDAISTARELVAREPRNPWSHFALAGALLWSDQGRDEALAASERALAAGPGNHDFLWLRAETLRLRDRKDEAIALLDSNKQLLDRSPELLVVKASALFDQSMNNRFEERTKAAALETFARARQIDSRNVNAHATPGWFLIVAGRPAEAHALLESAAALTSSPRVHSHYWNAVFDRPDLTLAGKRAELEPDIARLLRARGEEPSVLAAVAGAYGRLQQADRQKAMEDRVIEVRPDSREADGVLMNRLIVMASNPARSQQDGTRKAEFRAAVRAYIARERHHDQNMLGQAYVMLFDSIREDESVGAAELLDVVDGMSKYAAERVDLVRAGAAIALADRKAHLRKAEDLALAGLRDAESVMKDERLSETQRRERFDERVALMRDALGWVYFKGGRVDDAERELLAAHQQYREIVSVALHLARLYDARGDRERAELWYVRCLAIRTRGDHPCDAALRDHYRRRHSDMSGFDDYLAAIQRRVARERQTNVASSRIEGAAAPPAFRLKTLAGEEVSSDSLRGRVTVINFWGLWCAVCLMEMPALKKLVGKYRGADDVAILTINNDPNPDRVREWMERNGYEFPVLIDDGYWEKADVRSAPTTWFLDKSGAKAFEVTGLVPSMEEEFASRIETLRQARDQPSRGRPRPSNH